MKLLASAYAANVQIASAFNVAIRVLLDTEAQQIIAQLGASVGPLPEKKKSDIWIVPIMNLEAGQIEALSPEYVREITMVQSLSREEQMKVAEQLLMRLPKKNL